MGFQKGAMAAARPSREHAEAWEEELEAEKTPSQHP